MKGAKKRLQNAISLKVKSDIDKEINIICHEIMENDEELEDQGLNDSELNYVLGACMRTGFPNFDAETMTHRSPFI